VLTLFSSLVPSFSNVPSQGQCKCNCNCDSNSKDYKDGYIQGSADGGTNS
jgi:hypothetical protein